jgi:GAF domain-containing protein
MYEHELFVTTMASFTRELVTAYDADDVLQGLAERVTAVLGLAGSGVTMESGGHLTFATAAPHALAPIEAAQELTQQGPCVDAFASGNIVAVPDLTAEVRRWPRYAADALALGVRSVAAVPMTLHGRSIGVLNLYATHLRQWPPDDLAVAQALADMGTAYLANASERRQRQQLNEQLTRALRSRVVIEQAKGIVAEAEQVSVDEAFNRIRQWSRDHNVRLRDTARRVVERGLRP